MYYERPTLLLSKAATGVQSVSSVVLSGWITPPHTFSVLFHSLLMSELNGETLSLLLLKRLLGPEFAFEHQKLFLKKSHLKKMASYCEWEQDLVLCNRFFSNPSIVLLPVIYYCRENAKRWKLRIKVFVKEDGAKKELVRGIMRDTKEEHAGVFPACSKLSKERMTIASFESWLFLMLSFLLPSYFFSLNFLLSRP